MVSLFRVVDDKAEAVAQRFGAVGAAEPRHAIEYPSDRRRGAGASAASGIRGIRFRCGRRFGDSNPSGSHGQNRKIGDFKSEGRLRLPPAIGSPPAGFASLIVAGFPALLAEFGGKRFPLLWRGSREGFCAEDFHRRWEGHARTLPLIDASAGDIFGVFTPVALESRTKDPRSKGDPNLKSFLFSLKNPHNLAAKKFGLKTENQDEAIECISDCGPVFVGGICVRNRCNTDLSYTSLFGEGHANDTRVDGETFFTGSADFITKEIEVFEITD
jgi:hypothetical protein